MNLSLIIIAIWTLTIYITSRICIVRIIRPSVKNVLLASIPIINIIWALLARDTHF